MADGLNQNANEHELAGRRQISTSEKIGSGSHLVRPRCFLDFFSTFPKSVPIGNIYL